jgi:APA family basic amino acid/polyamine antiporter
MNENNTATGMKPTLGLFGILINAMALIAPGAFLWTTYQLQAAPGSAPNMWFSVLIATAIALFTAMSYALLAKKYPQAGTGSAYYFAENAFLEKEQHKHFRLARISKFLVGWASHLYYWIYPGVMVAFMGTLLVYIGQTFDPTFATSNLAKMAICIVFAVIVGAIAYRGVNSSTSVNLVINIIQIAALLSFSALAIIYRFMYPKMSYLHATALSVIRPHDLNGLIFQATIAILLVVGFESATAFAEEAKNPKKDIPRAVVLSLLIQAGVFYLIEYFAANFFIGNFYQTSSGSGFTAAFNSSAPIGDMAKILGDQLLGGHGEFYAIALAITVVIALVGTALSCTNTGVRITRAMGKDKELPAVFGFLHSEHQSPYIGIIVITVISAVIGAYGVLSIDNLTQVTLISNVGTFLLYGMTGIICMVAYAKTRAENVFSRVVYPTLTVVLNVAMLVGVIYYAVTSGGSTQTDTIIAITFSLGWLVVGLAYLRIKSSINGIPLFHPEDHKQQLAERGA